MLRPDITGLLFDEDIGGGQKFKIMQRYYARQEGRLSKTPTVTVVEASGTVQPAGIEVLQQLDEADRSGQVIVIRTDKEIQIGRTGAAGDRVADTVVYRGEEFKVLQVKDWSAWGMQVAYATRIGAYEGG